MSVQGGREIGPLGGNPPHSNKGLLLTKASQNQPGNFRGLNGKGGGLAQGRLKGRGGGSGGWRGRGRLLKVWVGSNPFLTLTLTLGGNKERWSLPPVSQ